MDEERVTENREPADEPAETPLEFIGRASATERDANTSERFTFWVRPGQRVNPFDIVSVEHLEDSQTYGLITNIHHRTDAASHLSNFISNDFGETVDEPNTPRQGTNVADTAVLSNNSEIYMPVQSEARVSFADEEAIHNALGIDTMEEKEEREERPIRIPAGVIKMSNEQSAVAYLDRDYVLGPEAGHLNVSGISGLATKTSYAIFLIQSILQTIGSENIAVILLNVKFDDLLHIDVKRDLDPEEHDLWNRMELNAEPFEAAKVHYLLPWGKDSARTGRPNSFGDPPTVYNRYAYALRETADKLDLLFSDVPDPSDTISSIVGEITQGIQNNTAAWRNVNTWGDLLNGPPLMQAGVPQRLGTIQPNSVGRFVRLLRRMVSTRQSGIFVDQISTRGTTVTDEIAKIQGGHTYVVDVARIMPEEQTLVFGDVLRTIFELFSGETVLENGDELPEKVIIFVDELNKYAPARSRGSETPILDQVIDISERGRSFGIILFSAQQFLSAVHTRVTGNSATKLLGRTDSVELQEGAYRFLDRDLRTHLTQLNKGELILTHPIYRQPVKITFPRPPFHQGR